MHIHADDIVAAVGRHVIARAGGGRVAPLQETKAGGAESD
jgi:hypothetical protein